jgi:thermitase
VKTNRSLLYLCGLVCIFAVGFWYNGALSLRDTTGPDTGRETPLLQRSPAFTQRILQELDFVAISSVSAPPLVTHAVVPDRYAGSDTLAVRWSEAGADGVVGRVRLVRTASKHPYHRVEELLQQHADGSHALLQQHAMAADHIVVVFDGTLPEVRIADALAGVGLRLHKSTGVPGGYLVGGHGDVSIDTVPALLRAAEVLRGATVSEPNFVYWHAARTPDDPLFPDQWGLSRINMPDVWSAAQETSTVIVAVFDTGTTLWHPDLYDNRWINDGEEIDSGLDDDGNGFVDDRYGWNFYSKHNDPTDLHGHGTHVHGIIGAVGNNAEGVAGVGWRVRTLPIAFMGPTGNGFAADAASGLYYVQEFVSRGYPIRVTNHSWGGGSYSEILDTAFRHVSGDVVHVAAAGNTSLGGTNNDIAPFYPASFGLSNMLAVANSTSLDRLSADSNYGFGRVHLAAPGAGIISTVLSGGYGSKSGTSMAAPHVAGVMALLMDAFPSKSSADLRAALLGGVEPVDALDGRVATGGRLDARGALLAVGPVIDHVPHPNVDADIPHYDITATIRPGGSLLAENGVRLYWDTDEAFVHAHMITMDAVVDGVFHAAIPKGAQGNRIYYWIEAIGLEGKRATHPATAPAAVHAFDITFPVDVHIQGLPGLYGDVTPSYGSHQIPWGSSVLFTAPVYTPAEAGARWRNIGWDGAGSVPSTGVTNQFSLLLGQTSYLIWRWRQQFELAATSMPEGVLTQNRWWDVGDQAQTPVAPSDIVIGDVLQQFVGWWVDGERRAAMGTRAVNPVTGIAMDRVRSAVAHYVPAALDSDGDGLPDWWQLYYFGHLDFGANDDPDGDGFSNAQEYADRSDPTDPDSYPEGPSIEVWALPAAVDVPGPWMIQASVTDRVEIAVVLLHWREVGDGVWQAVRMQEVDAEEGIYQALIEGPEGPGRVLEYRVFAEDAAQLHRTSDVYVFQVDYPVLRFGVLDHDVILMSGEQQVIRLAVTNAGTAVWHWNALYGYADPVARPPLAGWTSGGLHDQWHVSERESFVGPYSWFCGDENGGTYNASMDASLYTPLIQVGSNARLRFMHWPEMEHDGRAGYESYYWDGAVVELSTDGGLSFFAIDPEGGYPYRVTPNADSPFEDHRPCFGGSTGGWHEAVFDLSAFAGEMIQVRFRFGTDRWVEYRGWFVDDISFSWEPVWLQAVSTSGSIPAGGTGWVEWTVETSALLPGSYQTAWVVGGNAPFDRIVSGGVTLQVRPNLLTSIQLQQGADDVEEKLFVLRWYTESGRAYTLYSGPDLVTDQWVRVPGYIDLPGGGEMSYTGRIGELQQQFFRVVDREP